MADRTSAALFAGLFERLSDGKPLDVKAIWEMAGGYDFTPQQMECNDALKKLGLMWAVRARTQNSAAPGTTGPDSRSATSAEGRGSRRSQTPIWTVLAACRRSCSGTTSARAA